MGLRDFLGNMNVITGLTGDLRQQAEQQRQEEAIAQLRQQIPGAVQSGNFGDIAATSLGAGPAGMAMSREILGDLIKNNKKSGAGAPPSMGLEQLKALNVGADETQLSPLVGLPAQQQLGGISAIQKSISEQRQATETARRAGESVQNQRKNVGAKMDPLFKEFSEADSQYSRVKEALNQKTRPGDAVVFNFLARNVAGERGPLSNDDITRFASRAFGGDVQSAENFFDGGTTSILTPDQRKAFDDLLNLAADKYEGYKSRRMGGALTRAIADNPKLIGENDDLAPSLKKRIDQAGFTYKDGELSKVVKKETSKPSFKADGGEPLTLDAVKNPAVKARVEQLFKENPSYSAEKKAKIINNALKVK